MVGNTRSSWAAMRKAAAAAIATAGSAYALTHTERVEQSGRRRVMFVSRDYEQRLSQRAIERTLHSYRALPSTHPTAAVVERVGQKIREQITDPHMQFEFHVVESWDRNVVCLPGGKMAVHSGLVDTFTEDEDALAAVLFHEAVHGQLRHGSEKVSLSLLGFGAILFFVLEFGVFFFFYPGPGPIDDLMIRLAVDLPFTKTQEVEADTIALRLLAQACYDPRASVELHNRARTYPRGPFPFLAKHKINASRMHNLREASKEAQAIYENSDCASQRRAFHSAMRYFPSSNQ